jgi:hypothetical protein
MNEDGVLLVMGVEWGRERVEMEEAVLEEGQQTE